MKKKILVIVICLTLVTTSLLIVSGKKPENSVKRDGDWDYSSNSPDMFAIPEGNIGIGTTSPSEKLDVQGNIVVNNQRVKEYHGFPRPDYDSGWISYTGCDHYTLNHNLGGNADDYVVDIQFQKVTYGITNWDIGDQFYYWGLDSNSISLRVCWNDITSYRCRIWVYD